MIVVIIYVKMCSSGGSSPTRGSKVTFHTGFENVWCLVVRLACEGGPDLYLDQEAPSIHGWSFDR